MTQLAHTTIRSALLVVLSLVLAACGKQEPPAQAEPAKAAAPLNVEECNKLPDPRPLDDSAAGKARAVSEGMASRDACKKAAQQPNADLARIREIKEKEEAERSAAKQSEEEFRRGIKEGGSQPIRGLKY